jgi:hypothetical protein
MTNLLEQDVVPSPQSYIKIDRRCGTKTPPLEIGTRWGSNTIIGSQIRLLNRADRSYYYQVRCDCGFERLIRGGKMRKRDGERGCAQCKKLRYQIPIGYRFDQYTVIDNERILEVGEFKFRACLVRCDCKDKTERVVAYMNLKSGNSGGCGCKRVGRKVLDTEWRCLLSQLRHRARKRGVPCTLTLPQFRYISGLPCAYCSSPPANFYGRKITINYGSGARRITDRDNLLIFSGIDRVDSSNGYVSNNVLPCCAFCNRAKDDWTLDEFIERLQRLGCSIDKERILSLSKSISKEFEI